MLDFIDNHKALLATLAAALLAASGAIPPPYGQYVQLAAIVLAALSKGVTPTPDPTPTS